MKYQLVLIFCGILSNVSAQKISDSGFQEGFQFTVQHEENSNAFIRFDQSVLDLNYKVQVDRGYVLASSKDGVHNFTVTTQRFIDTVESEGRPSVYSSDNLQPQSSPIEKSIDSLLRTPDRISVSSEGVVSRNSFTTDVISELMGLYAGVERDGDLLVIFPGVNIDSSLEVGRIWVTETTDAISGKTNTSYKLTGKTLGYFTVEYERTVISDSANANENGVLLIDASTGLLEELNSKTISNARIFYNGNPCLVEKWSDKVQRFSYFTD